MAGQLHISINAEKVFSVAGVDISNSILTTWIVLIIILGLSYKTFTTFSKAKHSDKPSRFQSLVEMIIEGLYGLVKGTADTDKKARSFFPIVSTFFLFIIISNWIGLLPGVGSIGFREAEEIAHEEVVESHGEEALMVVEDSHGEEVVVDDHSIVEDSHEEVVDEHMESEVMMADGYEESMMEEGHEAEVEEHHGPAFVPYFRGPTADLNTTLALAFVSIVLVQYTGFKFLGLNYSHKFINFDSPIDFFVGILEFFSEISKIISFAFRLFGNIFAGEVLLSVIAFLMPVLAPLPFLGLEIFVGFIQALVFSMLTLVFLNMSTMSHGGDAH